eukprot:TRINITY_DN55248_c0_g1_i1.p1 TRINITY_DN55248_c0_g1~~TRINITY_DN55248_c0_g1_i1.p1  ORF type:complete len:284 (-),score=56.25 TRINITY_DN55248_c0_g1_i1:23-874(-)
MWPWFFRTFLGELGDKTFILTCVMSAWCPWSGVRYGPHSRSQRALVCVGAVFALWIRLSFLITMKQTMLWHAAFETTAAVLLFCLMPKAYLEFVRTEEDDSKQRALLAASTARLAHKDGNYGAMGMGSSFQDDSSLAPRGSSDPAEGLKAASASDECMGMVLAFLFTLILCLCAEAEDKSEVALLEAHVPKERGDVCAAFAGACCAAVFAVVIGFILERLVSDHRLNFLVLFALAGVAVCSSSQALLQLGCLSVTKTVMDASPKLDKVASYMAFRALGGNGGR